MEKVSLLVSLALITSILVTSCNKEEEKKIQLPAISTLAVTEIAATSAKSGGNITNDGGGEVTSKGILWSTLQNPTFEQHSGLTLKVWEPGFFKAF